MTNAMKVAVLPGDGSGREPVPQALKVSAAVMLRHSFSLDDAADKVERAVCRVLAHGSRTGDIHEEGTTLVGTEAMGDAVAAAVY